jgi:arylsulfatase A-like enzyme
VTRPSLPLALLLPLLALGLACTQPVEEVTAIRLVDLAEGAEAKWPRQRSRLLPEGVRGLKTFRQLRLHKVGQIAMFPTARDGDNRIALIAPTGSRYDFELTPPEGALLKVGLGYLPPASPEGPLVRFSAFLTSATGDGKVLLDTEIRTRSDGDWMPQTIDLSEWAGQVVNLTLKTSAAVPGEEVWAAWGNPEIVSPERPEHGPDVILISLDTLRADRLGSYGYERDTSPFLDQLARRSTRFAKVISQSPWTRPSHLVMLTGRFRGAQPGVAPRLPQVLHDLGYRTEALTGGGQMDFRFGFGEGFDSYRVFDWINDLESLDSWLDASNGRRRFLFLHTYEIHDPYRHPQFTREGEGGRIEAYFNKHIHERLRNRLTDEERRYVSDLYDGGIAYTDGQLRALFDRLEQSGALERSIVIVTSDHGEQFWEHNSWRHGMNLYDHQLLVPLIVHLPPDLAEKLGGRGVVEGSVVEQQVRLVDLVPTLYELLEIPFEGHLDGRSLVPLLRGEELRPVDAFSENLNVKQKESKSLRSDKYKYIWSYPRENFLARGFEERFELFDLTRDPQEQNNLAEERPEVTRELDQRLNTLLELLGGDFGELQDVPEEELDPDLRDRLEALGYIGS